MQQKSSRGKIVFSISKRYEIVEKILSGLPNKSEYICQAIIEKAQYPMPKSSDENEIREIVESVINEYIKEGKLCSLPDTAAVIEKNQTEPDDSDDFTPKVSSLGFSQDDEDAIKSAMGLWDSM